MERRNKDKAKVWVKGLVKRKTLEAVERSGVNPRQTGMLMAAARQGIVPAMIHY